MENLNEHQDPKQTITNTSSETPFSKTSSATAGANSTDEDAADEQFAAENTAKGFDRDQEELELGLDDGDLDFDLPADR
jgi:hypothetical protein